MDRETDNVCETCQGDGRVPEINQWSVDTGTKWQRNFRETVSVECPDCDGTGRLATDSENDD